MGLGRLFERNITYDVTNSQTGDTASYTIVTDGGPGMFPGWSRGNYRGAMSIPAAWRLSLLVANQLGRIPWHTFRAMPSGPSTKLPQPAFLSAPAGTRDTALSVFRSWVLDRVWHGNAIGIITSFSPLGYPTACLPVSAESVQVKLVASNDPVTGFAPGEIAYLINGRWYHQREVIHFKGPCAPGELRGMGILEEHFDLLDRSRKLDAAASAVDSSAVPTGLLKSLNPDMSAAEAQELKDAWQTSQRTRSVAVLNPLTEFTPIAWNPTETQLLESRKYGLTDWANVFGIDASYVGAGNASGNYANIENQGFELLKFGSVGDVIAEFEAVLTALMPRGQYVKGNTDHLLRADTKTRYEAHAIAISSGFRTRDEVRELEELPPLTAEQKAELKEMNAPAPPANNTQGAGAAAPRPSTSGIERADGWLVPAMLRAVVLETLTELRGRHSFNPAQPRDPDGQWSDGQFDSGGPVTTASLGLPARPGGRRRAPERPTPAVESVTDRPSVADPDDDEDEPGGDRPGDVVDRDDQGRPIIVGNTGGAGVLRPDVPTPDGYGGGGATGIPRYRLSKSKYCPDCGGKAQDPQMEDPRTSLGVNDWVGKGKDRKPLYEPGYEPERDDSPYHDPDDPDYEQDRAARPNLAASRDLLRGRHSFNPNQPRDPDGQWSDGVFGSSGGGTATAVADAPPRRRAARQFTNVEMEMDYVPMLAGASEAELDAVSAYTGPFYEEINAALRNPDGLADADPEVRANIADLDALMGRYRTPGTVIGVRALGGDPALPPPGEAVGKVITSRGYQSVTMTTSTKDVTEVTSSDIPRNFRAAPIRLRMIIPPGMPAVVAQGTENAIGSEREILLPHNTRYAITADEMEGDRRWLTVTALPPE